MELTIRTDGRCSHVEVVGRFDAHETGAFRAAVDGILASPAPCVRLDLRQVAFLDSSALAEIVRAMKLSGAAGGDLLLTGVSVPVRVILELTGMERVLRVVEDEPDDDGLASAAEGRSAR